MVSLASLWLLLVAAVLALAAPVHMVLPFHRSDYRPSVEAFNGRAASLQRRCGRSCRRACAVQGTGHQNSS